MDINQSSCHGETNPGGPSGQPLQQATPATGLQYISPTPFMDICNAIMSKTTEAEHEKRAIRARQYQDLFRRHYILSVPTRENAKKSHQERNGTDPRRSRNPAVGSHAPTLERPDQLPIIICEEASDVDHKLPPLTAVSDSNESRDIKEDTEDRDADIEMPDSCASLGDVLGSDSNLSVEDLRI